MGDPSIYPRVLLLTKATPWCAVAERLVRQRYPQVQVVRGATGDPIPSFLDWEGEILISFLCPWVLPAYLFTKDRLAINFHPAPPEYRGFAPYSWAIYHGASRYGITVHQMTPALDAGPILSVTRFAINHGISVWQLQQRTMLTLLTALLDFLHDGLKETDDRWSGSLHTRADLEALRVITPDLSHEEICRRARATTYPGQPGLIWKIQP